MNGTCGALGSLCYSVGNTRASEIQTSNLLRRCCGSKPTEPTKILSISGYVTF